MIWKYSVSDIGNKFSNLYTGEKVKSLNIVSHIYQEIDILIQVLDL